MKEKLKELLKRKQSNSFYANKLGISEYEVARLRSEIKGETSKTSPFPKGDTTTTSYSNRVVDNEKGTLKSEVELDYEPKSDIELAKEHKVDLDKYEIVRYWTLKSFSGKFRSTLECRLRRLDTDLKSQKEVILKELKEYSLYNPILLPDRNTEFAYEVNIPDVHFGKLSWGEEVGEDYDIKIAEKRYEDAIKDLLSLVDLSKVEQIIFPIGNDLINIDSRRNETFAGTGQDSDSRFYKIVKIVKSILIRNINALSLIAPVKVIVIAGNHDPESMFMLGEILESYYHNNGNVDIDNSPKQRKYYQYGKCGFQYTHGNEEKHNDLGLIFATEETKIWANTDYRFCKLGHFHKNKTTKYVSVDEFQGFQVQILPSLSGSDAWHKSKGYMSGKQAKGFLYHKEKGQIAEYTFNLK